jgi:hypothetical protein
MKYFILKKSILSIISPRKRGDKELKKNRVLLMLLLVLTLVIFSAAACSTNDMPDPPNVTDGERTGGGPGGGVGGISYDTGGEIEK